MKKHGKLVEEEFKEEEEVEKSASRKESTEVKEVIEVKEITEIKEEPSAEGRDESPIANDEIAGNEEN